MVDVQDWLYEDGEDASKGQYVAKLDELRASAGPIIQRFNDKRQEEEDARRKAAEEAAAKKRAEEEAKRQAEEEAKKRAAAAAESAKAQEQQSQQQSQQGQADAEMKDAPAEGEKTGEAEQA